MGLQNSGIEQRRTEMFRGLHGLAVCGTDANSLMAKGYNNGWMDKKIATLTHIQYACVNPPKTGYLFLTKHEYMQQRELCDRVTDVILSCPVNCC